MTIEAVDVRIVELDNVTLATSYGGNVSRRKHVFVAVRDGDGFVGYGEGSPLPHFSGERAEEMSAVIASVFGPVLVGIDAFDLESATRRLDAALPHHHTSKAALINALFDLQGKRTRLPANAFLGGRLRDRIALGGGIGIEEDDIVLERVQALWTRGIRTIKFKIGQDQERDVRIIRAVRERFPDDLEIRADANGGYRFAQAQRFLHAVAGCRLQYVEQPLMPQDWRGLARLRQLGTPIAADESLFGLTDALGLIVAEAADVLIVKLIKLGGLGRARKVAALAEAAGIACVAVSPYETALGVAASLHLAASSQAFPFAAELGVGVSSVYLAGSDAVTIKDGAALVPTAPGIGIDLPQELFDNARVNDAAL